VLGCVAAALVPLLYDRGAIDDGYIGELIVLCPTYLVLGLLIIKGKELLVELRQQAETLALLDPLTELPNRRAMLEWLSAETGRESPTGLILVDLDGFKDVNTAHGYPAGDAVLREAAARLQHSVRTDDVVARLGGDEFAVLAPSATPHAMRLLAERTLSSLRDLQAEDMRLTASVGWVIYPNDAQSVDELIAAADVCLRGAKMNGKDRALSALDWAPDGDGAVAA
jgi:diguanylate cyclase (GGDEF)-like protein